MWDAAYMDYKHEPHCVHLVVYHITWCPKRRRKVLVGPVAQRLKAIIQDVAQEHAWEIHELAIQPDHVHLFVRADPYTVPSAIPRLIKGRSSHHSRREFPHLLKLSSLWTRSYFLSTAGHVSSAIIQKYSARQATV
jgi:putative transposase